MVLDIDEIEKWRGKPKQGIVFSKNDILFIPFSLFWCGFSFFWEFTAIREGTLGFSALWGILAIVIGLYLILGRFIHDYLNRTNTEYIITNKRVIIKYFSMVDSIKLQQWSTLKLIEFSDGTGNILFSLPHSFFLRSYRFTAMLSSNLGTPALFKINNAKIVYNLLVDEKATSYH